MLDSVLGIVGILVSILFFFVGYRQTVGAKKERVGACNSEIERILVRRIVLEGYSPSRADLTRLIDGKARDFKVRPGDVLSEGQFMNTVYARVFESDLIPADKREEIIARVLRSVVDAEANSTDERGAEDEGPTRATLALAVLGAVASIVGSLVSALPEIANFDTDYPALFRTATLTAGISGLVIASWIVWYRFRTSQETLSSKFGEREHYVRFENEVLGVLKRFRVHFRPTVAGEGGDFLVDVGNRQILVEVKAWVKPIPQKILSDVAERTRGAARRLGSAEAIVVIPSRAGWRLEPETLGDVKVFGLDEFTDYVRSHLS